MTELDSLVPNYRKAVNRWPEAPTLSHHYRALVDSYGGNGHGLIEIVRSFIECVCLTVLGEFGKPMPTGSPNTTEMLVSTLDMLGLRNCRGSSELDRVLSAHNKLADALSNMRNHHGPVAHGKDGFLDTLTSNHLRTYLLTGDTLLCLILSSLEGTDPNLQYTREPYDRFAHFHDRIDKSVTVESAIEDDEDSQMILLSFKTTSLQDGIVLRVEPSRLLYAIDRASYIEILDASAIEAGTAEMPQEMQEVEKKSLASYSAIQEAPSVLIAANYDGKLSPLREGLGKYIESLRFPAQSSKPDGSNLLNSLLATAESNMGTDWATREVLQARMKIGLRKVLKRFDVTDATAKECANHLVTWFRIQAVGAIATESIVEK